MSEKEVLDALKKSFSIPGGLVIIKQAMRDVLVDRERDKEWIKLHFSELVERIQLRAYEHYLITERPAAAKAFREVFSKLLPLNPSPDDYFRLLEINFWALDKFFLGLTQGRRPRAGKAFEHVINVLFSTLEYPYTSQPVINGQPDFLLPGIDHYKRNPMDCIIFTVKRSLRERWRQIVTEGTRGHMFFLATIDENIGDRDLGEMLHNRIYLVMPDRIRAKHYPEAVNVISFESFFTHHLDPAIARWKANRIIE
jgi:hypothetical protein